MLRTSIFKLPSFCLEAEVARSAVTEPLSGHTNAILECSYDSLRSHYEWNESAQV